MTSKDLHKCTFSPELGSGRMPCAAPDGPTIGQSGQALAPASLLAPQENAPAPQTSATSGRLCPGSSASASLESSLVNRLVALTASRGSTLYNLTWKTRITPLQRSIYALRASARRTSGSVSTGWPTPLAGSGAGPCSTGRQGGLNIQTTAQLAAWPTPTATDGKGGYQGGRIRNGKLSTDRLDVAAQIAGWPTPLSSNAAHGMHTPEGATREAERRGWNNTLALAAHSTQQTTIDTAARLTATGALLTGSAAGMESGGQLDPDHSRWLMGLSPVWDAFAPTATR